MAKSTKKYVSDLLDEEYATWYHSKILLTAPVGLGKTYFILNRLVPFYHNKGEKTLILCNRRLLRLQYWFSAVEKYDCYDTLSEALSIKTYQELAEDLRCKKDIDLSDYGAIICDEAHFFYADSDFNGFGTYALLQKLVEKGLGKMILFMSATSVEAFDLIKTTLSNCIATHQKEYGKSSRDDYDAIVPYDFSYLADYTRFKCYAVPDIESICKELSESSDKSIFFIDNKTRAEEIRNKLVKSYNVKASDISVLNADNLDDPKNQDIVEALALANRLSPKILITSSVLDNGISIHDSDVKNTVIITESRISFLQMLGRIRSESTDSCNLFFVIRKKNFFRDRMEHYKKDTEAFEAVTSAQASINPYLYISAIWNNPASEAATFYRKSLVVCDSDLHFYTTEDKNRIRMYYGNCKIEFNEAAYRKTSNMYLIESRLYKLAEMSPDKVIHEQMRWIGKSPDELCIKKSTYIEATNAEFIKDLLKIQNFTFNQYTSSISMIVKQYHAVLFNDIPAKNGTLSKEKVEEICTRCGLKLTIFKDPKDKKNRYSINPASEVNAE